MKIAVSTAVLAGLVAPAFSLSYLESLNPTPVAVPAAANGAAYLDAIAGGSSAPSGAGLTSYLDALPPQPAIAAGAGIASFADSMGSAAPVAAAPVAAAPVAADASAPVTAGASYLEAAGSVASAGPPTGAGLVGYLDALPPMTTVAPGAGIPTYKDLLPVTNTLVGGGAGLDTYADALGGGSAPTGKSFSPFGSKVQSPSFAGTVSGSEIGFTLEASDLSSLIEQLKGSGGTIRLTGSIDSVSFA